MGGELHVLLLLLHLSILLLPPQPRYLKRCPSRPRMNARYLKRITLSVIVKTHAGQAGTSPFRSWGGFPQSLRFGRVASGS